MQNNSRLNVLTIPTLTTTVKAVYCLIECQLDEEKQYTTGIRLLSEQLAIDERTIKRSLRELENEKLISRTKRPRQTTVIKLSPLDKIM